MPRSPSDATRFTATGPYVSSKPPNAAPGASSSSSSQISLGAPAPKGESAQQKIARLRAAAAAAKTGTESQFDQMVRVGRRWADRAHRISVFGLMGFSVISAVVAGAGISDMIIHNRKRRNEWLAEQQAKAVMELKEAKAARDSGMILTEHQVLVLNRARAAVEAEEERKSRPGVFKRTTNWLFGNLSSEEKKGGRLGAGDVVSRSPQISGSDAGEVGVVKSVEEAAQSRRRHGGKEEEGIRPLGGPLDQQAELATAVFIDTSRSWLRKITGK